MDWCSVCCSRHAAGSSCPGALLATGPERHARRFQLGEGDRVEQCGILIAEAGEHWRARILTYPSMLWSVPGGRGTIKFAGSSPEQAERLAVAFIREHAASRGWTLSEVSEVVESRRVDPERAAVQRPRRSKEGRHLMALKVRFGEQKAVEPARTIDLSYAGLFVITSKPLPRGRPVKLLLELEGYTVPLNGTVAWVRTRTEPGRPVGMGIRLAHAPHLYTRYVDSVKEAESGAS